MRFSYMNIDEFINIVKLYKDYNEPKDIKVIIGLAEYYEPIQKYKDMENNSIEIYKNFKYYAFTLNNKCSFTGSDTLIWNILFNNKINAKKFFSKIKEDDQNKKDSEMIIHKLIYYLYFHEGIIMINRDKEKELFKIFRHYNVTDVLFVGVSSPYKNLTKYFNNARFGVIYHPAARIEYSKKEYYDTLDSSKIEEVSFHNNIYDKTLFSNFSISHFSQKV